MLTMRTTFLALSLMTIAVSPMRALAQGAPPGSTQVTERASAALERVRTEVACLSDAETQLEDVLRLVREAEAQRRAARSDAERRDAERAMESLMQRVVRIDGQARACRGDGARAASGGRDPQTGAPVVVRDPPADRNVEAVAQPNPATHVVERDTPLTATVRVTIGERVDGYGRVEDAAVKRGVAGIAQRIDRCYGAMIGRGALRSGSAILAFTITPSGRVANVRVEQSTFRNAAFDRCLRQAGAAIRPGAPAVGGDARYAYTLRFGGE